MGGGGGFNPLSVISTLVFGPEVGGLVAMATGGGAQRARAESAQAVPEVSQESQDQAEAARRLAERRRAEAALRAQAEQARVAARGAEENQAQTLGAPSVETDGLKARLGQ